MQPMTGSSSTGLAMPEMDGDILSHEFCIETHMADAMPVSHWHDHIEVNYLWSGALRYLINGRAADAQCRGSVRLLGRLAAPGDLGQSPSSG